MAFAKKEVVEKFKTHPTDTGSPEVQIAILTGRINYLSEHFKVYPKDHASRHGFLKLIGKRRRMLEYLKTTNKESYKTILGQLDLRK